MTETNDSPTRRGVARPKPASADSDGSSKRRYRIRRVPSRFVLIIAFGLGIVAACVVILPFSATSDAGTDLSCAPPLYEVLVPPDPAFDVAENAGCKAPAQQRLILAAVMAGLSVAAAFLIHFGRRYDYRYHLGEWLQGSKHSTRSTFRPSTAKSDPTSSRAAPPG